MREVMVARGLISAPGLATVIAVERLAVEANVWRCVGVAHTVPAGALAGRERLLRRSRGDSLDTVYLGRRGHLSSRSRLASLTLERTRSMNTHGGLRKRGGLIVNPIYDRVKHVILEDSVKPRYQLRVVFGVVGVDVSKTFIEECQHGKGVLGRRSINGVGDYCHLVFYGDAAGDGMAAVLFIKVIKDR